MQPLWKQDPKAIARAQKIDGIITAWVLGAVAVCGYLANIYWLWRLDWHAPVSLWMVLRIAGIIVVPLGVVLGFFP